MKANFSDVLRTRMIARFDEVQRVLRYTTDGTGVWWRRCPREKPHIILKAISKYRFGWDDPRKVGPFAVETETRRDGIGSLSGPGWH